MKQIKRITGKRSVMVKKGSDALLKDKSVLKEID